MSREIDCPVHGRRGVEWGLKGFEQPALGKPERFNSLLDSASQPPEKQNNDITSPTETVIYRKGELRGIQSVQSVVRALDRMPSVTRLIPTERKSQLDLEGIDLIAYVEGMDESIGIQVKSSKSGIYEFKKSLAKRVGVPRSEINNWCLENRLIILNGSIPEGLIIARFQEQLAFIKSKSSNLQFFASLK